MEIEKGDLVWTRYITADGVTPSRVKNNWFLGYVVDDKHATEGLYSIHVIELGVTANHILSDLRTVEETTTIYDMNSEELK